MSHHLDFRRGRAACVAALVCLALAAAPIAAKASAVGLGTPQPFVVLSGAGCVRLSAPAIAWLASRVAAGVPVRIGR